MRILLTEIRGDLKQAQREFDQRIIKIGRDPEQCDLVFNQTTWPMVSRLHAELTVENGRCLLVDKNSTQGTFLNRQPVVKPTEIESGARIQLGENGPVLTIDLVENPPVDLMATPMRAVANRREPSAKLRTVKDQLPAETTPPSVSKCPILLFESGVPPERGTHMVLDSEITVLGRDLTTNTDGVGSVVSRRHAEVRRSDNGMFFVVDLGSFNGTLVNGKRIAQDTLLHNGDQIQLSLGGPILRFVDPTDTSPPALSVDLESMSRGLNTIVYRAGTKQSRQPIPKTAEHLLVQHRFEGKQILSVGRAADNDITLDGLLISKYHARFIRTAENLLVEDTGSTNGVYLNGARISGRQPVHSDDIVQIGPFLLKADPIIGVKVFDTRSETRIDAVDLTHDVPSVRANGDLRLLDQISLAIEPNEFVGLLGPSGAGKSTLINALNGMQRTTGGRVFINNLDLYHHLYSIKQSIGYVPQDDIIHRELTCYTTLYYVARLRLSGDVPAEELDQIVNEVLEVTGLADKRDTSVSRLSGGQRKRVSIAVELITKPSVIFLDEPTSGLDPATEERIMKLFRQIAESGRTVIMTTHMMENVHLFDKIVLLMRGKLIFCGTPNEALQFVGVDNFIDLYNKLEQPIEIAAANLAAPAPGAGKAAKQEYEKRRNEIIEATAEQWRQRFLTSETYVRYISNPLSQLKQQEGESGPTVRRRSGIGESLRQWTTLLARYVKVLSTDRLNLLILFAQAPIIALLTYLVVGQQDSRDFTYFVLALIPIWFGTSVAAREIVKERSIFKRERMVNLGLLPYVGSKLFALSCIVTLQCLLLFGTLKVLDLLNLMYVPGVMGGLAQWLTMVLTGVVGIALGLFVSALVKTSEVATSVVPLILIPQILLCGLVGVPEGVSRFVGAAMPATWSFDEMKRLSTLDTLRKEGSAPGGENQGLGLFEHVKDSNTKKIEDARNHLKDHSAQTDKNIQDYDRRIKSAISRGDLQSLRSIDPPAAVGTPPLIPDPTAIKDDLREYVSFKHPWGGIILNAAVLLLMLLVLLAATMIALRAQDSRPFRTN